jgi:hypothetical protein
MSGREQLQQSSKQIAESGQATVVPFGRGTILKPVRVPPTGTMANAGCNHCASDSVFWTHSKYVATLLGGPKSLGCDASPKNKKKETIEINRLTSEPSCKAKRIMVRSASEPDVSVASDAPLLRP